jgi:hypothetical protein
MKSQKLLRDLLPLSNYAILALLILAAGCAGTKESKNHFENQTLSGEWTTGGYYSGTSLVLTQDGTNIVGTAKNWASLMNNGEENAKPIQGTVYEDKVSLNFANSDDSISSFIYVWRDDVLVSLKRDQSPFKRDRFMRGNPYREEVKELYKFGP